MAMFRCTGSVSRATAIAGSAVATIVESSICMNSAHPTRNGIIRPDCVGNGVGGGVSGVGGRMGLCEILSTVH